MEIRHLNQKQLAERWQISEASLERWRSEKLGPADGRANGSQTKVGPRPIQTAAQAPFTARENC